MSGKDIKSDSKSIFLFMCPKLLPSESQIHGHMSFTNLGLQWSCSHEK